MRETEYLEVALPAITPIFGLEMLGSPDTGAYVTSFTLLHSDDGHVYSIMTDDQGKPKVIRICCTSIQKIVYPGAQIQYEANSGLWFG